MPAREPPAAQCGLEASRLRTPEVRDLFRRITVYPPDRVRLEAFPSARVAAVFNPGLAVYSGELILAPRVLVGYYTYTSMVAQASMSVEEAVEGGVSSLHLEPAISPHPPVAEWGVEDPRLYLLGGRLYATYTGRLRLRGPPPKALPVTAVYEDDSWRPVAYHYPRVPGMLLYDKDAFIVERGGRYYLFHRPVYEDRYLLAVGLLPGPPAGRSMPLAEWKVLDMPRFESRIGWGAPPVEVEGRLIFILHGVDSEGLAYRAFAVEMSLDTPQPRVEAVTPAYIMAPRTVYEVYGDRPYTVFPTGAVVVDDKLIVAYGAGDYMVGLAEARVDEILSELDKGRVC